MAHKPGYEELEQRVEALENDLQNRKDLETALRDYISYKSVLAGVRGIGEEETEEVLLQAFLSEIVKQYGFCMSWYGKYANKEIRPVFSAGRVDRYLDNLVLKIQEPTSSDAQCAMSQAILSGSPFSYADLERDEGFRRWRDYALELGYRSNLALPLTVDGLTEGGIMVYADTPNAFPKERIERLQLLTLEMGAILRGRRLTQKAEEALKESEGRYRRLVEGLGDKFLIFGNTPEGEFTYVAPSMKVMFGIAPEQAVGRHWEEVVEWTPDSLALAERIVATAARVEQIEPIELSYTHPDGPVRTIEVAGHPVMAQNGAVFSVEGIAQDVTDRKRMEDALLKVHNELEKRVEERTAELMKANEQLNREIDERKQAEEALQKREAKLEVLSNHLQEVNAALRFLLKQREDDKKDLEENILANVKQLVSPHLQRLKRSRLDANQRTLISTLESNLGDIVSPFTSKLSSKFLGLTPMEIRIADLVKEGKTNKEIGETLCLSPNTVKFHRYNLRSKLGLKNKKVNLRTHLLSLAK